MLVSGRVSSWRLNKTEPLANSYWVPSSKTNNCWLEYQRFQEEFSKIHLHSGSMFSLLMFFFTGVCPLLVLVTLHGTITYPTQRTSRKNIDSKVRTGYGQLPGRVVV